MSPEELLELGDRKPASNVGHQVLVHLFAIVDPHRAPRARTSKVLSQRCVEPATCIGSIVMTGERMGSRREAKSKQRRILTSKVILLDVGCVLRPMRLLLQQAHETIVREHSLSYINHRVTRRDFVWGHRVAGLHQSDAW